MRKVKSGKCGYEGKVCADYDITAFKMLFVNDTSLNTTSEGKLDNYSSLPAYPLKCVFRSSDIDYTPIKKGSYSAPESTCAETVDLMNLTSTFRYKKDGAWKNIDIWMQSIEGVEDGAYSKADIVRDKLPLYGELGNAAEIGSKSVDTVQIMGEGGEPFIGGDTGVSTAAVKASRLTNEDNSSIRPFIMEPMLSVAFDPLNIQGVTAVDSAIDGITLATAMLSKWRITVDSKLNQLAAAVNNIYGIRNMLTAMQRSSICNNFKISLTSGNPITWKGVHRDVPTYNIAGGTILVNGVSVNVNGEKNISGEFYRYLNIKLGSPDKKGTYTSIKATLSSKESGDYSIGVGGVRKVSGADTKGLPRYQIYEIVQERCTAAFDLVRTSKGGVLFRLNNGSKSPYGAYEIGTCDTNSTGVDSGAGSTPSSIS